MKVYFEGKIIFYVSKILPFTILSTNYNTGLITIMISYKEIKYLFIFSSGRYCIFQIISTSNIKYLVLSVGCRFYKNTIN